MFEKGFLGSGATICARLLGFENDAHLTNRLVQPGFARWFEVPGGHQFWRPRVIEVPLGTNFPYGLAVSPP